MAKTSAEVSALVRAWEWRRARGVYSGLEAVRVFHGPGEGIGGLKDLAIDRFGDHYWVTHWADPDARTLSSVKQFLASQGALSAVQLLRPRDGVPDEPVALLGEPPREAFVVREHEARFRVRMRGSRHPGLFLDHQRLRAWLASRTEGLSVLNTFAYTGSLSVACGVGRAREVVSLDLSRPSLRWAAENWECNGLERGRAEFVAGDVFEWLPRFRREGRRFDCVIVDPPSFSRGKRGSFSVSKDLPRLHELALGALAPEGILVSSVNSAQMPRDRYESAVAAGARAAGAKLETLETIDLPESFPTPLGEPRARYLKGSILRKRD